jgi:ADP-ribose pyrophosphatase YjhB (NUDIX family)
VAALLLIDHKVLLVRHAKEDRSYHLLPGGGVEWGETLSAALVREVAEETGLAIDVGRPILLSDTIDPSGDRHVVNVTFTATVIGGALMRNPDDERIAAIELVEVDRLRALDLRPPIASEVVDAIGLGDAFVATYLGARFAGE